MENELTLEYVKRRVDDYIRAIVASRVDDSKQISPSYLALWEQINRVLDGGKRIRPYLTMVGNGQFDERVIPVAAAQEFIHLAMLMHDDVIDQDFVRRGVENINGAYRNRYAPYLEDAQAVHYAYSAGVLAGDALISEAYRLVYSAEFSSDVTRRLAERLATSIYEVIGGELMDVESGILHDISFDPISIYRYKTAGYSFIGPLMSGAACAGADKKTMQLLSDFATNVGIAFQIQDDLLGVFGNENTTGKSTITDLREGKRTLLVAYHEQLMDDAQTERFRLLGDRNASDESFELLKVDMRASGAEQKTHDAAESYFVSAEQRLELLEDGLRKDALRQLLESLRGRKW